MHVLLLSGFKHIFFFSSQFNILNEKMYELLGQIYNEMFAMFDTDMFHMGGDEVILN